MPPWEKYSGQTPAGPWAKYGDAVASEPINTTSPLGDIAASAASGVGRGLTNLIDLGGAVVAKGADYALDKTGAGDALGMRTGVPLADYMQGGGLNTIADAVVGEQYQPQTEGGRIAKAAGSAVGTIPLGGAGALGVLNTGRAAASGVGGYLGSEVGGDIGQAVGGDTGQIVGQIAGGLAGGVGGAYAPEAVGSAARTVGRTASGMVPSAVKGLGKVNPQTAEELASQGIEVSQATAGSDLAKGYTRRFLANSLFGKGNVQGAAERVDSQIDDALNKSIKNVGNPDDFFTTGQKVREGLDKSREAFKSEATQLYDKAESLINPSGLADGKNILGLIPEIKEGAKSASAQAVRGISSEADDTINSVVRAVNEDSKAGRLTVGTLLQMRKDLGAKLVDTPFSDPKQGALKKLYGAVSKDLEETLGNKATNVNWNKANPPQSEEALSAFKEANRFYRQGINEAKSLERRFGGSRSEEQVFNAVTSATKLDSKRLELLLNKMSPAAKGNLQASVLKRLAIKSGGQNEAGQSVETFVNNFSKLSTPAKYLLTGKNLDEFEKLARNWQRVAPLVKTIPETGFSGAGTVGDITTGLLTAAGTLSNPAALLAGAAKFGGDKLMSAILTRPQTLKVINKALEKGTPEAAEALEKRLGDVIVRSPRGVVTGPEGNKPTPIRIEVRPTIDPTLSDQSGSLVSDNPKLALGGAALATGAAATMLPKPQYGDSGNSQQEPPSYIPPAPVSSTLIKAEEGYEPQVYRDTEGKRTIATGFNLDQPNAKSIWKRAGVTENFERVLNGAEQISSDSAQKLFDYTHKASAQAARKIVPFYSKLGENQQAALDNLAFQLGGEGLRKFKETLRYLEDGNAKAVENNLIASKVGKQTPARTKRNALMLAYNLSPEEAEAKLLQDKRISAREAKFTNQGA